MFGDELDIRPGQRLGRFQIERLLGRGGMGAVFLATDTLLDAPVAIKVLDPTLATSAGFERFRREVLNARQVTHPGVCRIFDMHEEEGQYLISMEYVEGPTLHSVLQESGLLPPAQAIAVVRAMCKAVQAAHALDIVHRDIKPGNIIVRGQARVSVLDFGLSRAASMARITEAGMTMGTLHYMPPETIRGELATKQGDIYAVGVTLYQCVTGRLPFEGNTVVELQAAILQGRRVPPSRFVPGISPALDACIQIAMAVDPAARFASMRHFDSALARAQEEAAGELAGDPSGQPTSAELSFDTEPVASDLNALDPAFATESVRSEPEALEVLLAQAERASIRIDQPTVSQRTPAGAVPVAQERATETLAHPAATRSAASSTASPGRGPAAVERAWPAPTAAPPATAQPRSSRWLVLLLLLAALALGLSAAHSALRERGGLLALVMAPAAAADAASATTGVPTSDPDAGQQVAAAIPQAAEDAAQGPRQDAGEDSRGAVRRPPAVNDAVKPPPPLRDRAGRKSQQKRAMEMYRAVVAARDDSGVSWGDDRAFDRAFLAMRKARRTRDYDAVMDHAESCLDALEDMEVNATFVKAKLKRLNERAGDVSEDWFLELSVKINTAMNNGDFQRANQLINQGLQRLRSKP